MTDHGPTPLDLAPQTRIVARLARAVRDDQLSAPTPCPEYAVRNILGHLLGLAVAFRDAGRKDLGPTTDTDPQEAVPDIGPGWRETLPQVLDELAEAWRDPAAWTGETRAGGVSLPGDIAGAVATDELVVHGWDLGGVSKVPHSTHGARHAPSPHRPKTQVAPLRGPSSGTPRPRTEHRGHRTGLSKHPLARATGQTYEPDPAALAATHSFLAAAADDPSRGDIFGPVVPVPDDAPLLDRVIGLSGRDPIRKS